MTELKIVNLTKRFDDSVVVDNVSITVEPGRLVALLGPSGCGKTTTLRMIAGLTVPTDGDIQFSGQSVLQQPPERRNIGMVFQRYVLFPHMSVAQNVGFGLFIRGISKTEIQRRVREMLEIVQLEHLEKRFPSQLSGGQQQRVAIARTLVTNPQILLMDEPLSNLDAKLREEMRTFIKELQQRLNITTLFVTHDQVEAMELADQVGVMFKGKLVQFGIPEEVFNHPHNSRVADFMGATNLIRGKIVRQEAGGIQLNISAGDLLVQSPGSHALGTEVIATIRPEHIDIVETEPLDKHVGNRFKGTIEQVVYFGGSVSYQVEASGLNLKVLERSTRMMTVGQEVILRLNPQKLWIFPEQA
ncbi:MAG: ABC transporter ATP-binding protein [Thermaceae bacterium]|nr:ABC transporter ATP-binding protein [Thermaceae bacterium]